MKPGDSVPPGLRERYEVLAERYQRRGWKVPVFPMEGIKAQNLLYTMVAKLNDRKPLRVRYNWRHPMVVEDGEQRGERNQHNPGPVG